MMVDHRRGKGAAVMDDLFGAVSDANALPGGALFGGNAFEQADGIAEDRFATATQGGGSTAVEKDVVRHTTGESAVPVKRQGTIAVQIVAGLGAWDQLIDSAELPFEKVAELTAKSQHLVVVG